MTLLLARLLNSTATAALHRNGPIVATGELMR